MRSLLLLALFGLALVCARHSLPIAEDSDNAALDFAENQLDAEEEEDSAANPALLRVVKDARAIGAELEEASDIDENVKIAALDDIDHIAKDAKELASASPSRAKNLKLAIDKRMKALKMMTHEQPDRSFEEEEKISKVVQNAKAMLRTLEEVDLDDNARAMATANVNQIAKNAKELAHASPSRAKNLKLAIKKRMDALDLMIKGDSANEFEEEEEESPAARVIADVAKVGAELKSSNLSPSQASHAKHVLSQMSSNAKKLSSASGHQVTALKQKIKAELEEFKSIVGEPAKQHAAPRSMEEEEEAVTRIVSDVSRIKQEIKSAHVPKAVKKEAMANLHAITRDAEEMPSANGDRRHNLEKAIKLRVAALREQLE